MKVSFIGLGQMGAPMAHQLLNAGMQLTVFDKNEIAVESLADAGAKSAGTIAEATKVADAIITMLPNSAVVENVVFSDDGILSHMSQDAILIDMGSSHPVETEKVGARLKAAGRKMVDAPVSGGVARAETGSLAIMVGGEASSVKRVMPLLEIMGSSVTNTGALASAHALKALNNLLSASGLIAAAEVLLVGQRFGLDPATMLDALNASSGMNNSTKNKFPNFVLTRSFDSGFSLDLMVKDLSIALDLAKATKTATPSSAITRELAAAAQSLLGPGADHTEAVRLLEKMCGEEISGDGDE